MQERDFFITFVYPHFTVLTSQGTLLDFSETGNTSDISIVFIAVGTTYFIQNEGYSLSFAIYYRFVVLPSRCSTFLMFFYLHFLSFLSLYFMNAGPRNNSVTRN
jgi:hypothetical protein